ncbi:hypothetical protein MVEN_02169700 [Mycena venus]|uniref:DUF6535 domain-containing protein n=1 Tax=Mycena venus TaxID=2733690 RepID=A0A8H7CFX9_9AGAR|nr:hypothetical protein MVEN_02169700 [Mycena venus]
MAETPTLSEAPLDAPNITVPVPTMVAIPTDCPKFGEAIEEIVAEHANRIVGAIHKQSTSLTAVFENLRKAVEALKKQPQSMDKKTTFWTAYKTLADEFDKELQRKYGDDLDTSLIFAGLFSAVSSAFIIQIQPELQSDPTQALLTLLVQNMTGVTTQTLQMSRPTGPATIIVVAQGILYVSLLSTLLAALLAVLGKQWLLHYDSVGERGTIEERGLERQRKFDGMRRWKFDLVMQIFPLLLQFSLFLFAVALSVYLWTIHHGIAALVLVPTGLGFAFYTLMIVSAVMSPDSPFQTSLSFLLKTIVKGIRLPNSLGRFCAWSRNWVHTFWTHVLSFWLQTWLACSSALEAIAPLLPLFNESNSRDPVPMQPTPIFDPPPPPSKEVAAVIWALETSTDPHLVEISAAMVPELSWVPVDFDMQPAQKRLIDIFESCFNGRTVRRSMVYRANACIRAFRVLECFAGRQGSIDLKRSEWFFMDDEDLGLSLSRWGLRFISAMHPQENYLKTVLQHFNPDDASLNDKSALADFLFCLNSFFSPLGIRDWSVLDKSRYAMGLTTLLLENLQKRLTDKHPLNPKMTNVIFKKLSRFADIYDEIFNWNASEEASRGMNAAFRLCAIRDFPQESLSFVLRCGLSLRFNSRLGTHDVEWVYRALEKVQISRFDANQPISPLQTILSALSRAANGPSGQDGHDRVRTIVLKVFFSADHWFQDPELRPILQQESVWINLGGLFHPDYINLGDRLCSMPEWKHIISLDLPGWLANFPRIEGTHWESWESTRKEFWSVLSRVWDADEHEADAFGNEKSLVMIFSALAKTWHRVDFSNLAGIQHRRHVKLLGCTASQVFYSKIVSYEVQNPSQRFTDTIIPCLGEALGRAAERAKDETINNPSIEQNLKDRITALAELLSRLALTTHGEIRNGQPNDDRTPEMEYWKCLRDGFMRQVNELQKNMERPH